MARIKKQVVVVAGALVLTGAVCSVIAHFNQPVSGIIHVGQSRPVSGYAIDLTPRLQTGQYASFTYPAGLSIRKSELNLGPIMQQFTYVGADTESWVLATDVSKLPNGDLNNDSSFSMREHNPRTYTEENLDFDGQRVIVMTDTTAPGFSKTAYIKKGNLVGTVSLTGDNASGTLPLATAFTATVHSWHWQ